MKMTIRLSALLLALAAGIGLAAPALAADPVAGQLVFKTQCAVCHTVVQGKNMIGPSLFGIVGRKASSIETFHYSAANKASGLTWDAETLDKYITAPRTVVPGTIMTYVGLKDDAKRADLIAYLATVK